MNAHLNVHVRINDRILSLVLYISDGSIRGTVMLTQQNLLVKIKLQ